MLKKLLLTAAAFLGVGSFAIAAGMYQGLPIVSSPAYCASTENGNCVSTIPAGPTQLTGNELFAADTQLGQGIYPQTVALPLRITNAGPYQYNAPLTGASITVLNTSRRLMLEPAGTIAALTVVFPTAASLLDNQTFGICSRQVVTALTITNGAGATVLDPPTALTAPLTTGAASCVEWVYRVANTSWYRVQ